MFMLISYIAEFFPLNSISSSDKWRDKCESILCSSFAHNLTMIYLCVHLLVCLRSSAFDKEIEDVIATIVLLLQSFNEVVKILSAVISLKEIICIAVFTSTMMTNPDTCFSGLKNSYNWSKENVFDNFLCFRVYLIIWYNC